MAGVMNRLFVLWYNQLMNKNSEGNMKEIGNFFARLSSRKFLLTIGGIIMVTLFPENTAAITTLIGIFVGGEGVADTVSRYAVEKTKQLTTTSQPSFLDPGVPDDDEITGVIAPGSRPDPSSTATIPADHPYGGDAPL